MCVDVVGDRIEWRFRTKVGPTSNSWERGEREEEKEDRARIVEEREYLIYTRDRKRVLLIVFRPIVRI